MYSTHLMTIKRISIMADNNKTTTFDPSRGMASIQLGSYERVDYTDVKDKQKPYVLFGIKNEVPKYLVEAVEQTTIHGTLVKGIAEMVIGDGLVPDPKYPQALDGNQNYLLESWKETKVNGVSGNDTCGMIALNLKAQGGAFIEVTRVRKVTGGMTYSVKSLPNQCCAPERRDGYGITRHIYVSKDFEDDKEPVIKYPIFNEKDIKWTTSIIWIQQPIIDTSYFAKPDYFGNVTYIEVERGVAEYHASSVEDGFTPTHLLNLAVGVPSEDKQKAAIKSIHDKYSGSKGKRVIITFSNGQDQKPEISQIQSGDVDKQYSFVSELDKEMTFVSHRVTSPALFGIRDKTGLGNNADELYVAFKLFEINVLKGYRQQLIDGLAPVMRLMGITMPLSIKNHDMEWMNMGDKSQVTQQKKLHKPRLRNELTIVTDEQSRQIVQHLKSVGRPMEYFTGLGWTQLYDEKVDVDDVNRTESDYVMLAIESDPDLPSRLDVKDGTRGTWLVRYMYDGPFDDRNRDYCHDVMGLNLLYRKEDIDQMSFRNENKEFGRYSIWRFKGSYGCRHHWKRVLFYMDNEDGDIRRVGNVPKVISQLPDEEATRVNAKPTRKSKLQFLKRFLDAWPHS